MRHKSVELLDVRKAFGANLILDALDLEVEPGEFVVLLGPSGCGKSTLLNVIAGLEPIAQGRVLIGEEDMTEREPGDRNIAMVFQSFALYPTMSARRNIAFGLRMAGMPKTEAARRVEEIADLLQISQLLDRRPAHLSGGEQQRVAIARALVRDPDAFLLDEPLSNLDANMRTELRGQLKRLHDDNRRTTIYVTHDQMEAMTLATRVAVMKGGRIQQFDRPQVVYSRPANLFTAMFVGSPAMNLIAGRLCVGDPLPVLRTASDGLLQLPGLVLHDALAHDADVVLGIRPEDLRIEHGCSGPGVAGRAVVVESTGPDMFIAVETTAGRLTVRMTAQCVIRPEQEVMCSIDGSAVSLFSRSSGLRLN